QGTNNTVTVLEDHVYTFSTADFGFSDPTDAPSPNSLQGIKITTLPGPGTMTDDSFAVTAGQFVSAADISGNKLKFTPAANANGTGYASFTFQVQDDGGTANSCFDLDQSANTITISLPDALPISQGTNNTVTVLEDHVYTFSTADFGFSDPTDAPSPNS